MKNNLLSTILSLIIFFFVGVTLGSAQAPGGPGPTSPPNPTIPPGPGPTTPGGAPPTVLQLEFPNPFVGNNNSLFDLLKTIINDILLPIGGVLAVLAFIYTGFLYVTAQGNETKLSKAHTALLYTVIGTALLLGSWVFANVICQTIAQLGVGTQICPTNP